MIEVESLISYDKWRTDLKSYKDGHTFQKDKINSRTGYLIKVKE